jgi:hypothetical protein
VSNDPLAKRATPESSSSSVSCASCRALREQVKTSQGEAWENWQSFKRVVGELETAKRALEAAESLVAQPQAERETCRDHGSHLGFHWCPECYQRAYAAGHEAAAKEYQQIREILRSVYYDRWLRTGSSHEAALAASERSVAAALRV